MKFGVEMKYIYLGVFFFSFIRGTLTPPEMLVSRNTLACDIEGI